MKNIAPQIVRQRLLIEANYSIDVTKKTVTDYLYNIAIDLNLKTYGKPTIHSPSGQGKEINQGFDAFIPLIDSGISLYIWGNARFMSCVIYTCKEFSVEKAIKFTKEFFKVKEIEFLSF